VTAVASPGLRRRRRVALGRALPRVGAWRGLRPHPWRLILAGLLLLVAAGLGGTAVVYHHYAQDLPSIEGFGTASLSQVTRVFASDGRTLLAEHYANQENRTVVDLTHISVPLQQATIAVEDRDFYSHNGIDPLRIVGALVYDLTHRQAAQGASTITQQVVKTAVLKAPERSLNRKVKELILAVQLDSHYSKQQILAMYLNDNNYGNSAYGIEAAAQTYFHVHAKDLQLPEASFLAGIPNSPARFNPLTPDGYGAARGRQRVVLDAMVHAGYITSRQADAAWAKDLEGEIKATTTAVEQPQTDVAPHFADYVFQLMQERYGQNFVDHGGLTVITTLDPHAQQLLTDAVQTEVANVARVTRPGPNPDGGYFGYAPNDGAALVMSPQTGAILALVGSVDYHNPAIQGDTDMPVEEPRQVGSSFKSYVYATALANGYTPSSTLEDSGCIPIGAGQCTSDFDGRQLGGISLAYSIQQSRNISSEHLFLALGPDRVFATAKALGVDPAIFDCARCNHGASATLGTNPMPMIEHVAAYGAFANGGRRVHPWAIARITDNTGRVILDQRTPPMEQAIPAQVALQMAEILKGAERPAGWSLSIPFANKSGTTEHWTDSWFMGFSTDLVIGTWMGHTDKHFDQFPQHVIYGENGAGLIMRDFVKAWYAGTSPPDFGAGRRLDPCRAAPASASASASPAPQSSRNQRAGVPQAPYQYAPAPLPQASPGADLSVLCAIPSAPPGAAVYTTPSPQPAPPPNPDSPPPPIIVESSPTPGAPTPHPSSRCTILQPFCH
jgi:membrane peptidoglycan carboxypeptidase